jgi:two-component system NtrC family response regulator
MRRGRILVADDDASLRRVTALQLEKVGYAVSEAADGDAALGMARKSQFDLVLSDLVMEGFTGLELLERLRAEQPGVPVVIFTAFGTVENAVTAMRAGAWDYITTPVHPEGLQIIVGRALEHLRLRREVVALRATIDQKYGFEHITGQSRALLTVLDTAIRIAASDVTVLITGETGTGKELLARALHANSLRTEGPFQTVNCAAIPRELLEAELFGHTKGAFTGAVATRAGKAELADGGTLFLDEIGELPLEMQAKLLRLVQQNEVEKIGSGQTRRVDVRIVAATNRDLAAMVRAGAFREDLYYRLAVIPLRLPPLRERPEDIPLLVDRFFAKFRARHGRAGLELPKGVAQLFTAGHDWPGNIRELENAIERAVLLAGGMSVEARDLPEALQQRHTVLDQLHLSFPPQGVSLETVEKELIRRALEQAGGNQSQAARLLRITRKTLLCRIEKHGLMETEGERACSEAGSPGA